MNDMIKKSIMKKIRTQLGAKEGEAHRQLAVQQWLMQRKASLFGAPPSPENLAERVQYFTAAAVAAGAVVESETNLDLLPTLLRRLLEEHNLPRELVIMDESLEMLVEPLQREQDIMVHRQLITQPPTITPVTTLTISLFGVAETGTLLLASLPQSPSRLYFLPRAHIALLSCQQLLWRYEDALALFDQSDLPRALHFITGPSRTADIAQTIKKGMHGPEKLFIILVP